MPQGNGPGMPQGCCLQGHCLGCLVSVLGFQFTEMEMSFWWNFHHWLHWKLSFWQLPMQSMMKISSKWWHSLFSFIRGKYPEWNDGHFVDNTLKYVKENYDILIQMHWSFFFMVQLPICLHRLNLVPNRRQGLMLTQVIDTILCH